MFPHSRMSPPQPVEVKMDFAPPIRPRIFVDYEMLEAERLIHRAYVGRLLGYEEASDSRRSSGRGKGTMMGDISAFQGGQKKEREQEKEEEEGEWEEEKGGRRRRGRGRSRRDMSWRVTDEIVGGLRTRVYYRTLETMSCLRYEMRM
ncbi:hypothetical protein Dimus_038361 [Dionaea muscipula]